MADFLPTSTETLRWGVRPHDGETDSAFVRELADRDITAPPRRRESLKIIEVNGERAGVLVLRKTKGLLRIVDLRLVERWRWRGIEKEVVEHLVEWANENSLVLKRPGGLDFPDSVPVGKMVKEVVAAEKARKKEKGYFPSGRTWAIGFAAFFVLLFLFGQLGLFTWTTLTSGVRHIRLEAIRTRVTFAVLILLAMAAPALVAELRGRLAGGAVLRDLGTKGRRWWILATAVLSAAAAACFCFGGWSLDTGGAMGRTLLLPAIVTTLLALRRSQVREGGILRPVLPGFIPWNAIAGWGRDRWGSALFLSRHVPGSWVSRISVPDHLEIRERLGNPLDPAPSASPNLIPLIIAFVFLTQSVDRYIDDIPKERPPGNVAFTVDPDALLVIGEEDNVALFPFRQTGVAGGWEELDRDMIDDERERIDAVLHYHDVDGRPAELTMAVSRYG